MRSSNSGEHNKTEQDTGIDTLGRHLMIDTDSQTCAAFREYDRRRCSPA